MGVDEHLKEALQLLKQQRDEMDRKIKAIELALGDRPVRRGRRPKEHRRDGEVAVE